MAGHSVYLNGSVGSPPRLSPMSRGFSTLGFGMKGFVPQQVQDNDHTYADFEQIRYQLVQSWNNVYNSQIAASNLANPNRKRIGRVITPFRAVNNAGDLLSRTNYSCNTGCQTFQSRPNLRGLKQHFGSQKIQCDETGVPAGTCNGRYVYDSSDYSTYLKQKAIGKTYNNLTNGGNANNGSQVAWRAIRRY
jgi:hypothetical protein